MFWKLKKLKMKHSVQNPSVWMHVSVMTDDWIEGSECSAYGQVCSAVTAKAPFR